MMMATTLRGADDKPKRKQTRYHQKKQPSLTSAPKSKSQRRLHSTRHLCMHVYIEQTHVQPLQNSPHRRQKRAGVNRRDAARRGRQPPCHPRTQRFETSSTEFWGKATSSIHHLIHSLFCPPSSIHKEHFALLCFVAFQAEVPPHHQIHSIQFHSIQPKHNRRAKYDRSIHRSAEPCTSLFGLPFRCAKRSMYTHKKKGDTPPDNRIKRLRAPSTRPSARLVRSSAVGRGTVTVTVVSSVSGKLVDRAVVSRPAS